MSKTKSGFTIVELLIVIVVIGILAAITIVAYNGIHNRSNDAAVQSDLAALAKTMEIKKIDSSTGLYPWGGQYNSMAISVSKNAYRTTGYNYNLLNCTTYASATYAILAVSKSGNKYWISSTSGGVRQDTSATDFHLVSACPAMLPGSVGDGASWDHTVWLW